MHLPMPIGILSPVFENHTWLKLALYIFVMAHLTITAMSLSFHRFHTHKGVVLNRWLDAFFQIWLWAVTSMSKLDWVSVHAYHHSFSDQPKDPHSPVQKGLAHVFFLGAWDYTKAKKQPDVLKIRKLLPANALERFLDQHLILGPISLSLLNLLLFGPFYGTLLSLINFTISPLFAVGGVNALAHYCGYRNHNSRDNSRNLGFIFPLNFILCGELDHNNHHAYQRSCSFRHRWFEFDIGYFYLRVLQTIHLAKLIKVYNPASLKQEFSQRMRSLLEADFDVQKRCRALAEELGTSYEELQQAIEASIQGQKIKLEKPVRLFIHELKRTLRSQNRFIFESMTPSR